MDFVTSAVDDVDAAADEDDDVVAAGGAAAGELGGKQAYTPDEEWSLQPLIVRRE